MFSLTKLVASLFAQRKALLPPLPQLGFVEQRYANPARKQRRDIIARLGRRQGIRWIKAQRVQRRANAAELARLI